jgi:formate hydrogenlyase subunit 4
MGPGLGLLAILGLLLALVETVNAKLRILRVADLLGTAAGIGGLSLVARAVFGS